MFDTFDDSLRFFEGAPRTMAAAHRHSDIELTLVVCGALAIEFGSTTLRIPERTFCAFWAAMPHRIIASDEPETFVFSVALPLARVLHWNLPAELSRSLLDGQVLCTPNSAMDEMSMRRWRADLAEDSAENTRIVSLELEARLRRMARSLNSASPPALEVRTTSTLGAGKAERMAQYIAEHFAEPLRVEQIAGSAHVHPTYAMHLFRETYGVSMIDYLTQRRIAHAQMLLATTDGAVAAIAVACGFHTVSRFYAVFREHCGRSPRIYRESLRPSTSHAVAHQ
jgi:AraC-like DNA-binding protein